MSSDGNNINLAQYLAAAQEIGIPERDMPSGSEYGSIYYGQDDFCSRIINYAVDVYVGLTSPKTRSYYGDGKWPVGKSVALGFGIINVDISRGDTSRQIPDELVGIVQGFGASAYPVVLRDVMFNIIDSNTEIASCLEDVCSEHDNRGTAAILIKQYLESEHNIRIDSGWYRFAEPYEYSKPKNRNTSVHWMSPFDAAMLLDEDSVVDSIRISLSNVVCRTAKSPWFCELVDNWSLSGSLLYKIMMRMAYLATQFGILRFRNILRNALHELRSAGKSAVFEHADTYYDRDVAISLCELSTLAEERVDDHNVMFDLCSLMGSTRYFVWRYAAEAKALARLYDKASRSGSTHPLMSSHSISNTGNIIVRQNPTNVLPTNVLFFSSRRSWRSSYVLPSANVDALSASVGTGIDNVADSRATMGDYVYVPMYTEEYRRTYDTAYPPAFSLSNAAGEVVGENAVTEYEYSAFGMGYNGYSFWLPQLGNRSNGDPLSAIFRIVRLSYDKRANERWRSRQHSVAAMMLALSEYSLFTTNRPTFMSAAMIAYKDVPHHLVPYAMRYGMPNAVAVSALAESCESGSWPFLHRDVRISTMRRDDTNSGARDNKHNKHRSKRSKAIMANTQRTILKYDWQNVIRLINDIFIEIVGPDRVADPEMISEKFAAVGVNKIVRMAHSISDLVYTSLMRCAKLYDASPSEIGGIYAASDAAIVSLMQRSMSVLGDNNDIDRLLFDAINDGNGVSDNDMTGHTAFSRLLEEAYTESVIHGYIP